ncbi:hypothetical protein AN640_06985 [Candidatus Epulonipiscium fishelsonii]|uniref:Uncharacterized protein n=1 Tax=Candidatus Epulonipiscium fishelsonii TaxID=77094 RepID=A0ACC8XGW0_9FIRM|nr:hypothetical protein AN640_06985 [Epulopiscium sp. SCG-D08WGA-EpuloA1]OON97029.1 MAG: hypothetical protein ATN32_00725 [Epulopiscium sp. AS2M-Bin002]
MILQAINVTFGYSKKNILSNINFQMTSGEVVGLLAPSGYGKTTFANILAGNLKPHSGEVFIYDNQKHSVSEFKGFYPIQIVGQHPEKSLNPRWILEKSLNEAYTPSLELRKQFGLQDKWLTRWPNELSGGELQRFCILRLLADELKFLILDEISTMLDAITQAQIWHSLLNIAKERNLGLIVISHNKALIERVCTRTLYLANINFN